MSKASKLIDKILEGYADDPTGANMMSMNVEDAEDDENSPSAEDAAKNQFPVEKDEDAVFPVDDKDVELKKLPPGIKYEDELELPASMDKKSDEDPKMEPEDKKNEDSFGGFDKEGLNQLITKAITNAVDQVIKTDWAKLYPVELKQLPPGVKSEDAPEELGLPTCKKDPEDKEDDKKSESFDDENASKEMKDEEPKKEDEDGEEMGLPFAGEEDEDPSDELSIPKMKDEAVFPVDDKDVELKKLHPGIKYEDDEEKSASKEDAAKNQFPAEKSEDAEPGEDSKDCPMDKMESAKWDAMIKKLKGEGYGDKAAARISGYIKARKGK